MRFKREILRWLALQCLQRVQKKSVQQKRKYYPRNNPHISGLALYLAEFAPGGRYHDLPVDRKHHKLFRRRCSLPYTMFAHLCQRIRHEEWEIPNIKIMSMEPMINL